MAPPPTLPLAQFPRDAAAIRNAFRVPWTRHFATTLACRHPAISMRLGEWESKFLADRLEPIQVDRPIYIAGLGRRAIVLDDPTTADSITQLWVSGEEPRAWARYWSHVYGYLARRIAANPALAKATLIIRYEDLCHRATETLTQLADHCELEADQSLRASLADWLHAPTYYQPKFTAAEQAAINEETQAVAEHFGYFSDSDRLPRAA